MARAMSTRRCCPPDSSAHPGARPGRPGRPRPGRPGRARGPRARGAARTRARPAALRRRPRRRCWAPRRRRCAAGARSPPATPPRRPRARRARRARRRGRTRMSARPRMPRTRVDLPEPLAPSSATAWPSLDREVGGVDDRAAAVADGGVLHAAAPGAPWRPRTADVEGPRRPRPGRSGARLAGPDRVDVRAHDLKVVPAGGGVRESLDRVEHGGLRRPPRPPRCRRRPRTRASRCRPW